MLAHREIGQEGLDVVTLEFTRMAALVKVDEASNPPLVSIFGARAVSPEPDFAPQLTEESWASVVRGYFWRGAGGAQSFLVREGCEVIALGLGWAAGRTPAPPIGSRSRPSGFDGFPVILGFSVRVGLVRAPGVDQGAAVRTSNCHPYFNPDLGRTRQAAGFESHSVTLTDRQDRPRATPRQPVDGSVMTRSSPPEGLSPGPARPVRRERVRRRRLSFERLDAAAGREPTARRTGLRPDPDAAPSPALRRPHGPTDDADTRPKTKGALRVEFAHGRGRVQETPQPVIPTAPAPRPNRPVSMPSGRSPGGPGRTP